MVWTEAWDNESSVCFLWISDGREEQRFPSASFSTNNLNHDSAFTLLTFLLQEMLICKVVLSFWDFLYKYNDKVSHPENIFGKFRNCTCWYLIISLDICFPNHILSTIFMLDRHVQ